VRSLARSKTHPEIFQTGAQLAEIAYLHIGHVVIFPAGVGPAVVATNEPVSNPAR
jgi:hypothetical protein